MTNSRGHMETSEFLALEQASREHIEQVCEEEDLMVPPENIELQFSEMFRDMNGMCISLGRRRYRIVMSPLLYRNRSSKYYVSTLEHELSHAEAYYRHGSKIEGHGTEWQEIAHDMGVDRFGVSYRKPDKLNICTMCEFFEGKNFDPPQGGIDHPDSCPKCGADTCMVINDPNPQHLLRLEP